MYEVHIASRGEREGREGGGARAELPVPIPVPPLGPDPAPSDSRGTEAAVTEPSSVVEEGSISGPVVALSCEGSVSEGRKRSRHSDRLEVTRDMYEDGSGERDEGQGEGEGVGATSWKPYGCKTCRRRFRTEQVRAMTGSLEWFQMREGQGDGVWEGDSFVLICCLCGLRTRVQTVGR